MNHMNESLPCIPCKSRGHICETTNRSVEGDALCVFCEDDVECPVRKAEKRGNGGTGERVSNCKIPRLRATRSTASPFARDDNQNQTNQNETKESSMKKEKTKRTCSCGCGGELRGRWTYLKGHGVKAGEPGTAGRRGRPKGKRGGRPANGRAGGWGAVTLTVTVDARLVEKVWQGLTIEEKARILQPKIVEALTDFAAG